MVEFPISGPYRETLLTMELIILFIAMEIAMLFFYKYHQNRKRANPSVVEFDWGLVYLSYCIAKVFYLISDFENVDRSFVPVLGYFSLSFGMLIFFYHIELNKILNTRFLVPLLMSGLTAVLFVIFLVIPTQIKTIAYSMSLFVYIILIIYFIILIKRIWKTYRLTSIGLFLGVFLFLLGFTATSDASQNLFNGFEIRIIGDLVILAALLSMAYFLGSIPSLAEIGWQDKLRYIIITRHPGMALYSENFQEKKKIHEVMIAGALYGVEIFLQTLLKEEDTLKSITKEREAILIERGRFISGILIADQPLQILKYRLKQLVTQFEDLYSEILEHWDGRVQAFAPTRYLIESIFSRKINTS